MMYQDPLISNDGLKCLHVMPFSNDCLVFLSGIHTARYKTRTLQANVRTLQEHLGERIS